METLNGAYAVFAGASVRHAGFLDSIPWKQPSSDAITAANENQSGGGVVGKKRTRGPSEAVVGEEGKRARGEGRGVGKGRGHGQGRGRSRGAEEEAVKPEATEVPSLHSPAGVF